MVLSVVNLFVSLVTLTLKENYIESKSEDREDLLNDPDKDYEKLRPNINESIHEDDNSSESDPTDTTANSSEIQIHLNDGDKMS